MAKRRRHMDYTGTGLMSSGAGKGDFRRPASVDKETFDRNYEKTFGAKTVTCPQCSSHHPQLFRVGCTMATCIKPHEFHIDDLRNLLGLKETT